MKLDEITARVRLRPGMRTSDFGIALARRWWSTYMPAWCLITIPFFAAAAAVVYFANVNAILMIMALWWLKPLFDRVILFVLSRAFFGEELGLDQTISLTMRSWLRWPVWMQLTVLRLIPVRGTFDPVLELERPRLGDAWKRYSNLLGGFDIHGLFLGTTMEWVFFAASYFVLGMVMPETIEVDIGMVGEAMLGDIEAPELAAIAIPLYWIALTFVEPFFVATGFASYINRRVELEGWDIELTFRRLAERLRKRASDGFSTAAAILFAAALAFGFSSPQPAFAQDEDFIESDDEYVEYEEEPRGYYDDEGNWVWQNEDSDIVDVDTPVRDIREGHYDENGDWVEGPGYYDDEGRWIDVEGQFDADGVFIEGPSYIPRTVADGWYERSITDPEAEVKRIVADPEFGEKVVEEVWRLKGGDKKDPEAPRPDYGFMAAIAAVLEILAYVVLAIILLGLIYLVVKRFGGLGGDSKVSKERQPTAVVLPDGRRVELSRTWLDDVMPAWNGGDRALALSLLYRGVLRDLKEQYNIKVPDSSTARETVYIVKKAGGPHEFVREVAYMWTREVYAARGPRTEDVERAVVAYRELVRTRGEA